MKKNVLLVVNPVSGSIDKLEIVNAAIDFALKENIELFQYTTSNQDDIQKLQAIYQKHKPERIIIVGGDGTIKMIGEAMIGKNVILGILPAGSANGLAVDLNLMKTIQESLYIAFYNDFIELDTIIINEEICLHLSDLGINAELVKNYEKSKTRGKWSYFLQTINTLWELEEPFNAIISINERTIECEARMIVIANSKKYGTGIIINPDGVMNDGKFEIVLLKKLDLLIFGEIIIGNIPVNQDEIEIISSDKALIRTNIPVSFQIDGEYYGQVSELNIKISSQKIKVAVP